MLNYQQIMYAGVDIGGSKTLVASLDANGVITEKIRFETPQTYDEFLSQLAHSLEQLAVKDFAVGGLGLPATHLDRQHGIGVDFGNLPWKNVPILQDAERLFQCPFVIENDAKLAALSEAMLLKDTFRSVLYVTISTGIGLGLVVDGHIDTSFGDGGGRTMLVEHEGRLQAWESFASGSAIVRRYGKRASDINDMQTWQQIVRDLSRGFLELTALVQPDVIVIGGSVGTHFNKYGALLSAELKKYETPLLSIPPIRAAGRPEEAVLFGAYDLAKTTFAHSQHAQGVHQP